MHQKIFFTLSEMKTEKVNIQESKERKFEKKLSEKIGEQF